MAGEHDMDIRAEIVALLMEDIERSRFPSATMLDMVEQLADQQEREEYARVLLDKLRSSRYPSIPMTRRLLALA